MQRFPLDIHRQSNTPLTASSTSSTPELHDYFNEVQNSTTLELPLTDADFESLHIKHARKDEIKEPAALYAIR